MTMGHLLRSLIIVGFAIQLCNGTCYWNRPRQRKLSIRTCSASSSSSSSSTSIKTSSKFNVLSEQNNITYLSTRLQNLGNNDEDDSGEYNSDSCEDLEYRDQQSTRKMKMYIHSRALSKKIKKKLTKITKKTFKNKVVPIIMNKVVGAAMSRSITDNGFQKSFQTSTTTTSSSNTVGVAGNVFLSVPVGFVANTMTTTTTRLLSEQDAVRLGLLNNVVAISGSGMYSSYQNSAGLSTTDGSTVSRSINSKHLSHVQNTGVTSGYLQNVGESYNSRNQYINARSQQYETSVNNGIAYNQNTENTLNFKKINAEHTDVVNGNNAYVTKQVNQNTGTTVDHLNVRGDTIVENDINKSYQSDLVHKNSQLNHASQQAESKQVIQKLGTTEVNGTFKSDKSDSDESDVTKPCEDTNDNNSEYVGLDKHRSLSSSYSRDTKVVNKTSQNVNGGIVHQNLSGVNKDIQSDNKQTVNVTHKRSTEIISNGSIQSNEQENNIDQQSNESDEEEDDDYDNYNSEEVSVYEYLNTYTKFRFDRGLNSVGIINEVLSQLDYQRYKLMDDSIYPQDSTRYITNDEVFDFIIIGAGNGGCVLANKLSENSNWNILLIDAGGDPLPVTQIPGLWDRALNSPADWGYKLEPDSTTGFGITGNMIIHKGKCLGGSSVISPQHYVRGSEKLYNSLVKKGITNWSYNNTETYFKRVEKIRSVTTTETSTSIYGKCGLVPVSTYRKTEVNVLEKIVCSGFEHVGCKRIQDINDKNIEVGFVSMKGTIKNGRNFHAAKAYLTPTFGRENLKVMKYSTVTRVLIEKIGMKATGVEVLTKFGQTLTLKASKEVIVCAGAIGSAKILLNSGIGPKKHLSEIGVPFVKDLPVGGNFLIAPVFAGLVVSYDKSIIYNQTVEETAFKYLSRNAGFMSTPKGMSFGGFLNTGVSGCSYADVEVHQFYVPRQSYHELCKLKSMFGFSDNVLSAYANLNKERDISIYSIALINTKSIGKILLRNSRSLENPIIIGNMLTHKDDVKTLLEAIKLVSGIQKSDAMKLVDATLESIDLDGCAKYEQNTDDHWKCLLKYMVSTTSSTAGSCRMGLETDSEAVVNSELNVIGVSNLRVVGRSVLPTITSAYSHIPCTMIAERAVDVIQSKYKTC